MNSFTMKRSSISLAIASLGYGTRHHCIHVKVNCENYVTIVTVGVMFLSVKYWEEVEKIIAILTFMYINVNRYLDEWEVSWTAGQKKIILK